MAVDTRDKRFSFMHLDLPFPGVFPNPDGTIDAGDRLQFLRKYRGIGIGVAAKFPYRPTLRARRR
jgi:hypothetical protein